MNVKDYVANWEYGHNDPVPKKYLNKLCKIEKNYKILLKADPETFEYGGKFTSVKIKPKCKFQEKVTYRIYMSTIDDSMMNLWLNKVTKEQHYKLLKYHQSIKIVKSCYDHYDKLRSILDLPSVEDYYDNSELYPNIDNLDFN